MCCTQEYPGVALTVVSWDMVTFSIIALRGFYLLAAIVSNVFDIEIFMKNAVLFIRTVVKRGYSVLYTFKLRDAKRNKCVLEC